MPEASAVRALILMLTASLGAMTLAPSAGAQALFQTEFCKKKPAAAEWDKIRRELGQPTMGFGARLLKVVAGDADEKSVAFSPYSVSAALALAMVGARGATASELAEGLGRGGVPTGTTLMLEEQLIRRIGCPRARGTLVSLANRLFLQKGKKIDPEYAKTMRDNYDATVGEVDFAKAAEAARKEINDWVARMTMRKITDLLAPRSLTADTRLVLVNALHLKGQWAQAFPKTETKVKPFKTDPKTTVQVPTMAVRGLPLDFAYAERKKAGYRAVGMRLDDGMARVLILLPEKIDGLDAMVAALDGAEVDNVFAALAPRTVELSLPRFTAQSSFDLRSVLTGMGIKAAFDAKKADFSGIDQGQDRLFIGTVAHKAFVAIDELGIEGAAATAVGMAAGGMPPKATAPVEFRVDHPFAFLVVDELSRIVLFQGVVRDPS